MAYMGIVENGYRYFDKLHNLLFTTDKEHEYLLNYVTKDISCLPDLFSQYISAQMDVSTLELNGQQPKIDEIVGKIKSVMASAHPYYQYEFNSTIIKEIGQYFNNLLMYLRFRENNNLCDPDCFEGWYKRRIHKLLQPLTVDIESYAGDFYNEYQKRVGEGPHGPLENDPIGEHLDFDVPPVRPIGFGGEIQTQKEISNMLYFILDISVPELEQLTLLQRTWMYGNIFQRPYNKSLIKASQKWSLFPPYNSGDEDCSQGQGYGTHLNGGFEALYSLGKIDFRHTGIPADLKDQLAEVAALAATQSTNPIYVEYEIHNLRELVYLEVLSMIQAGAMVKKCRRCGKYFVFTNRNASYCNRIDESGARCSIAGPQKNFLKKMSAEEALKIYNRAYKTRHARMKKGTMGEEDFRLWHKNAKERLEQVRTGNLDITAFQEWLKG